MGPFKTQVKREEPTKTNKINRKSKCICITKNYESVIFRFNSEKQIRKNLNKNQVCLRWSMYRNTQPPKELEADVLIKGEAAQRYCGTFNIIPCLEGLC